MGQESWCAGVVLPDPEMNSSLLVVLEAVLAGDPVDDGMLIFPEPVMLKTGADFIAVNEVVLENFERFGIVFNPFNFLGSITVTDSARGQTVWHYTVSEENRRGSQYVQAMDGFMLELIPSSPKVALSPTQLGRINQVLVSPLAPLVSRSRRLELKWFPGVQL